MNNFTNLYPVQKTLRFELKPPGETADRIKDFNNKALFDVVKRDEKRAEEYLKVKKILDDYYRDFIAIVLSKKIFTDAEIKEAFTIYEKSKNKDSKNKDKLKKDFLTIQKKLRSKTAKAFNSMLKENGLDEYKSLINEKGKEGNLVKPLLWHWLNKRLLAKQITKEDFEEAEKTLRSFNQFTTYFKGFKENRDNMFSEKDQTTAISYRIVHENMIKHFDNCIRFDNIKKNHKTLFIELKDSEKNLKPEAYSRFLNQNSIDDYNKIIGGDPEDQNKTGINQKINLYRQKNNIKGRDLPFMSKFYKQILSDSESRFTIEKFEDHEEMLKSINEYYNIIFTAKNVTEIAKLINEHVGRDNAENIFIKNDDTLTGISQFLFKEWNFIKRAMEKLGENKITNKKERDKWLKSEVFSLGDIQAAVDLYLSEIETKEYDKTNLAVYFNSFINENGNIIENINKNYKEAENIIKSGIFNHNNRSSVEEKTDTDKLKNLLDSIMELIHFLKPLHLFKKRKPIEADNADTDFYDAFNSIYNDICLLIPIYNKTRNLLTKKSYSTDKIKINFDRGTLLDGWDVNKETANLGVLLLKDDRYYLAIMDKDSNNIFDYNNKKETTPNIIATDNEEAYLKMNYKLIPNPSRDLPHAFFAKKNKKLFSPTNNIKEIRDNGLYKKEANDKNSMYKWIDFCKDSIKKHEEWNSYFKFQFRPTKDYADVSGFYKEVAEQGYSIDYTKIKAKYIEEKIKSGELYLFEIYNKDFSEHSKGTPSLHTLYWKAVFNEENLRDVVVKLNGEAEIFFRAASIEEKNKITHKAGEELKSKNPLNKKRTSTFKIDLIKDKRFTKDKFFFHCPVTLNFKAQGGKRLNERVNRHLENNKEIKFIGIDRGERHLLYYSVIDRKGKIVEQGSFNKLISKFETNGEITEKETDYRDLLNRKERERDEQRKSWSTIENIKELKSGYLSNIIHRLAALMIKHNAVIVLEDLNSGFMRGRFKIEKQVYQKFEKALIQKLNYLVFKDRKYGEAGHYLKAYQLTDEFTNFEKLGKQTGFLFYVPAKYTSKIDPVTGFVNLLYPYYENLKNSQEFFGKFKLIKYNKDKDYFEFTLDYNQFTDRAAGNTRWTICSHGKERYCFDLKEREAKCYNVTEKLKELVGAMEWQNCKDLKTEIERNTSPEFFKSLFFYLRLLLMMRYTGKDGNGNELDYILSPVADKNGNFFDSRESNKTMPLDADANGAYHIALKGLMTIKGIEDGKLPKTEKGMQNKDWFEFAQNKNSL